MRFPVLPIATVAALLLAGEARATVVSYTDQSAFDAAVTGLTTYQIPAPVGAISSPYPIGPVSFSSDHLFLTNDGTYFASSISLSYIELSGSGSGPEGLLTLAGAGAIGLWLGNYDNASPIGITVNGMTVPPLNITASSLQTFIGLVSSDPITSVAVYNMDHPGYEIDVVGSFTVGSAGSTGPLPEPGSLWLLGSFVAGLTLLRSRGAEHNGRFSRGKRNAA